MSEQSFTDTLRRAAIVLAKGEEETIKIPDAYLQVHMFGKKSANNPAAYIRQIMSRVPEVAERGRVSVTRGVYGPEDENFGSTFYEVRIVEGRRKVYNKEALERAVRQAKRKVAEAIIDMSPNLANYAPEEYETLSKAVADFHAMIKKTFLEDEQ